MPGLVALRDAPGCSGSDDIGIRRTDSSMVARIGLSTLLGDIVLAWVAEEQGLGRSA